MNLETAWNDIESTTRGWVAVEGFDRAVYLHRTKVYRTSTTHDVLVSMVVRRKGEDVGGLRLRWRDDYLDRSIILEAFRKLAEPLGYAPAAKVEDSRPHLPDEDYEATWIFRAPTGER